MQIGTHFHRAGRTPYPAGLPVSSIRLWDAELSWKDIEPESGNYQFGALDKAVNQGLASGIGILYPLGMTPQWASSAPSQPSAYGPGNAAPPADPADWERFVRTVTRRYRGRISAYEIWNEPNLVAFYSGSVEQLADMTCAAKRILLEEDPSALLVGPAPTEGEKAVQWLRVFLATDARNCIDVIGIHLYTHSNLPPEGIIPIIDQLKQTLGDARLSQARIWNTEFGWKISNARVPNRGRVLLPAAARDYLLRSLLLQASMDIERAYQYSWNHRFMGLAEPDTGEFKDAVDGIRTARRWLDDEGRISCRPVTAVMLCTNREGTSMSLIAWSLSDEVVRVPIPWRGCKRVELPNGGQRLLNESDVVYASGSPVRIAPCVRQMTQVP